MWKDKDGSLYREFKFNDFGQAFGFMTAVAEVAEAQNHHPKWLNEYNKVEIWLNTHSAGNKITDKDHRLAKAIDNIYEDFKI